jgi:hypothetical protein
MSAIPKPAEKAQQLPMTEEDGDAMFKSVVWFREQRSAGKMERYRNMHVAILGERVIDADEDLDELGRRLDAMGDSINQNRVAIQYYGSCEELPR